MRRQEPKWQTHIKWAIVSIGLLGGSMGYHITHPIIHTLNRAISTAKQGEHVSLQGRVGCNPVELNGNL